MKARGILSGRVAFGCVLSLGAAIVFVLLISPPAAAVVYFSDDFDPSPNSGWSVTENGMGTRWEVGSPSGLSGCNSPPNCYVTNLATDYTNGASTALTSPSFDLSTASIAYLVFQHWYDTESCCDFGTVSVSNDGGVSWSNLDSHSGRLGTWMGAQLDLTPFLSSDVRIRFSFTADLSITGRGWIVDDIMVTDQVPTFQMACTPLSVSFFPGGTATTTCTVTSENAFTGTVLFQCFPGYALQCAPNPGSVLLAPNGTATVTVTIQDYYGYGPGTYSVEIRAYSGSVNRSTAVNATVVWGSVSGQVRNRRDTPIANAQVDILDSEGTLLGGTTTDSAGRFNLTTSLLGPGTHTLRARFSGFEPTTVSFSISVSDPYADLGVVRLGDPPGPPWWLLLIPPVGSAITLPLIVRWMRAWFPRPQPGTPSSGDSGMPR